MNRRLGETVSQLVQDTIAVYRDDLDAVRSLERHARQSGEPLRIAVAGMVKAGKSTLINALLGEEIAPTATGECTKSVIWYRHGATPRITVFPVAGEPGQLPLQQVNGRPSFDIDAVPATQVERVVVEWPNEALRDLVLIDTPGIASLSGAISERSNRFLLPDDESPEADAIVYVLRRLHEADLRFLKAFRDTAGAHSGAVNAVVVLSRADEIGAGRIESLLAARNIATRYRRDATVRSVASGVVPVAGRLAQTARTLHQAEFEVLVELTRLDRKQRDRLMISADRFIQAPGGAPATSEGRAALLERFGLFGIRLATVLIQNGFSGRDSLARELTRRSGLDDLVALISGQFLMRSTELKARAAVLAVEGLLWLKPRAGTERLAETVERLLAESHEFRELQLLATARTTGIGLESRLAAELRRLVGGDGTTPTERLGLPADASRAEIRSVAQLQIQRWRTRAENPLTDRATADLCRIAVRSCEGILADENHLSTSGSAPRVFLGPEPGAGPGKQAEDRTNAGERQLRHQADAQIQPLVARGDHQGIRDHRDAGAHDQGEQQNPPHAAVTAHHRVQQHRLDDDHQGDEPQGPPEHQ